MHYHLDSNRFKQCLEQCGEMFGRVVSKEQMAAYFTAMEDLHIDCIAFGIKETMKHELRFPTPAKIREFANMHRLKPETPQIHYKSMSEFRGVTEFGAEAAALLKSFASGEFVRPKFYFAAVDLADKYGKKELSGLMMEDFNAKYGKIDEPCPV